MAQATTIRTLPPAPPPTDAAAATDVLAASSRRFGRDVASIDKALRELLTASNEAHETSRQRTA